MASMSLAQRLIAVDSASSMSASAEKTALAVALLSSSKNRSAGLSSDLYPHFT